MKKLLISFLLLISFAGCNMEKEIDLKLPDYENKMVIEMYLIPGQPYILSIFESVSYFEEPNLPTVDSALVTITHNEIVDTIPFDPFADPLTFRYCNYRSTKLFLLIIRLNSFLK